MIQYVTNVQREELKEEATREEEAVRKVDLAQVDDDPETPVPMLTRPRPDPNMVQAGAEAELPEVGTKKKLTEEEKSQALVEALTKRAKAFMCEILKNPETRKQFHSWLFKLADINDKNQVTPEGLKLLLQALAYDGISSDHLTVGTTDPVTTADAAAGAQQGGPQQEGQEHAGGAQTGAGGPTATPQIAAPFTPVSPAALRNMDADSKRILEEYDTGKVGFLTKEEFMALADVITENYQLLFEDSLEYVGKYHLTKKIGEGASASVWIGVDKDGNRKAVKMLQKGDAAAMSRLDVEIKAMIVVRHPNIVSLEEVLETDSNVYFVMELLTGGNLGDHVAVQPFHNDVARAFFEQILLGVEFCHSKSIYHRDLKLENIMLDSDGRTVKVGDFGHAAISPGWDMHSTGLVGSLFHVSPEQINGECYSGEKIDIWALGVLLYRMLTGKPPFFTENVHEMMRRICTADFAVPPTMSPLAADLIHGILRPDPDERLSLDEIFDHPWMSAQPTLATIPSLLTDVYVADCIAVSKDVIIMCLHDVIRHHNIRTVHRSEKFDEIQCYALDRELRFIVRVKTIQHEAAKQIRETLSGEASGANIANSSSGSGASSSTTVTSPQPLTAVPASETAINGQKGIPVDIPGVDSSVIASSPAYSPIVENERVHKLFQQQQQQEQQQEQQQQNQQQSQQIQTEEHQQDNDGTPEALADEGELLNFEFSLVSGFGIDFRRVVQSIKSKLDKQLRATAVVKTAPPSCLDTKSLLQSAAMLAEQFRDAFADSLQEEKATVLLLGKTGSGKSSVANKIFGTKLAEVGQGKPVTKHFRRHQLDGKPVVIYDSKGYEVNTAAEFAAEIQQFFEQHNSSAEDHIHVVWYVVDGTSSRFEPFEAQFCKTVLADVPTIVLVNKADLCQQSDILSLKKTIETVGLAKCAAVVPTVAVDALGPPPDKCTRCGSDDVSELRKKRQWRCNECEFVGDLQTSHTVDDGMKRIVEITQRIVPDRVREAFVSGQMVSIQDKITLTKAIITECYSAFLDPNQEVALRRVLRLLARICFIWDITAFGGSAATSNARETNETAAEADETDAVSLPVARQVLSMALPLLKRGADDDITDPADPGDGTAESTTAESTDGFGWGWGFLERVLGVLDGNLVQDPAHAPAPAPAPAPPPVDPNAPPPPPPPVPTAPNSSGNSVCSSPRGDQQQQQQQQQQQRSSRECSPEVMTLDAQLRSAVSQRRASRSAHWAPDAKVIAGSNSVGSSSSVASSASTSNSPSRAATAAGTGTLVHSASTAGRMCCASASSSPSALRRRSESVEPAAAAAGTGAAGTGTADGEGARALLRPFEPERRRSGSLTRTAVTAGGFARGANSSGSSGETAGTQGRELSPAGMLLPPAQGLLVRTMSAAAMTGTTTGAAVEARAPSEACLVTTAVTIAWAEALMRLHILIVENGIQMPPDVLTRRRMAIKQQAYTQMLHVVQLCFDRAFVSFNTDRVTWLKESLSAHPLREILDSVLSPPQLMPKIAVGAAAAPATATGDAPAAAATGTTATVTATGSRSTSSDKLSNSSDSINSSNTGIAAAPKLTTSSGASMSMPALPSLGATAAVAGHGDSSKTTQAVAAVASPRVGPGGVGSSTGGTSSAAAGTTAGTVVAPANSSTVPGPAPLPSPIVHAADAVIATPQKPAGPGAQTASPPQPAARTSTAALSPLATQSVLVVPLREPEDSSTPHSPRAPLSPPS